MSLKLLVVISGFKVILHGSVMTYNWYQFRIGKTDSDFVTSEHLLETHQFTAIVAAYAWTGNVMM